MITRHSGIAHTAAMIHSTSPRYVKCDDHPIVLKSKRNPIERTPDAYGRHASGHGTSMLQIRCATCEYESSASSVVYSSSCASRRSVWAACSRRSGCIVAPFARSSSRRSRSSSAPSETDRRRRSGTGIVSPGLADAGASHDGGADALPSSYGGGASSDDARRRVSRSELRSSVSAGSGGWWSPGAGRGSDDAPSADGSGSADAVGAAGSGCGVGSERGSASRPARTRPRSRGVSSAAEETAWERSERTDTLADDAAGCSAGLPNSPRAAVESRLLVGYRIEAERWRRPWPVLGGSDDGDGSDRWWWCVWWS